MSRGRLGLSDDALAQLLQGTASALTRAVTPFTSKYRCCTRRSGVRHRMRPCIGLCRMLDGGCDALYIARRVVRMASEDIGNADPRGLQLALNAWDVQQRLGSPEGNWR